MEARHRGDAARMVKSGTWQRRAVLEEDYYTPPQAADVLQISRRRVIQMLNADVLQGEKLRNGRWRIPAAAVAALLRVRSRRPAALQGDIC